MHRVGGRRLLLDDTPGQELALQLTDSEGYQACLLIHSGRLHWHTIWVPIYQGYYGYAGGRLTLRL